MMLTGLIPWYLSHYSEQLLDLQTAMQCATVSIESATTLLPGTQIPLVRLCDHGLVPRPQLPPPRSVLGMRQEQLLYLFLFSSRVLSLSLCLQLAPVHVTDLSSISVDLAAHLGMP